MKQEWEKLVARVRMLLSDREHVVPTNTILNHLQQTGMNPYQAASRVSEEIHGDVNIR